MARKILLGIFLLFLPWAFLKSLQRQIIAVAHHVPMGINGTTSTIHYRSKEVAHLHLQSDNVAKQGTSSAAAASAVNATKTFDQKKNGEPMDNCRRACPHYNNRIILQSRQQAGMNDRTYIMLAWANLGMFLCAHVKVPTPSVWLVPKHNTNGSKVHENVTFERDLLYFVNSNNSNEIVLSDLIDVREPKKGWGVEFVSNVGRSKAKQKTFDDGFFRAYAHTVQQQEKGLNVKPFQWTIKGSHNSFLGRIHRVINELRESNMTVDDTALLTSITSKQLPKWTRWGEDTGCVYASRVEAKSILTTANRVMNQLRHHFGGLEETTERFVYGYLHVRRGDSHHCDSNLAQMGKYIECTFSTFCQNNEGHDCKKDFPLLIGSDEQNETYRQGLFSLINSHPNLQAVNLDKEVTKEIKREISEGESPPYKLNNFCIYLVEKVILQDAAFYLQQNRQYCPDCESDNVVIDQDKSRRWWSSWLPMNIIENEDENSEHAYDNLRIVKSSN